jgi:hypothetical protein
MARANKNKKNKKLPMSNSEPLFTCAPFGSSKYIHRTNCYSYAIGRLKRRAESNKLQPGNLSGDLGTDFSLSTCHPAATRARNDLRASKMGCEIDINAKCPVGYSKAILMLDKNSDYHFYRQNGDVLYGVKQNDTKASIAAMFRVPCSSVVTTCAKGQKLQVGDCVRVLKTGVFSHKRGTAYGPSLYDASNNLIFDPRFSDNNYDGLNYDVYCSSFCVKRPVECTKPRKKKTTLKTT